MRSFHRAALLALGFLAATLGLAQTTGDIVGRVTDEQGGALPGATVEARSPAFQGVRTSVTDATGTFRLILLPPGAYTVTATLPGFARVEQHVTVALGQDGDARHPAPGRGQGGDPRDGSGARRGRDLRGPGHQHRQPEDPVAADRPQLHLDRPDLSRRLHPGDLDLGVRERDHRLRLDRPGERVRHRRRPDERRRVRRPGQGAQLRVHPGAGREDRRLRGRVRPLDRRHHQRHHQVGRQRVPRRGVRLLRQRLAAGQQQAQERDELRHVRRLQPARLRRLARRLHRQGPPLVLRRVRPGAEHDQADDLSAAARTSASWLPPTARATSARPS